VDHPAAIGLIVDATSAATAALVWGIAFALIAVAVQVTRSLHLLDQPVEQVAAESATL
jgi:hypothetical protein